MKKEAKNSYLSVYPPLTGKISPVMKLDICGEARNKYAGAISSGCAGRPILVFVPNDSILDGLSLGFSGVHTGPGATAFTRIPNGARLPESARVKLCIPPFVIE